MELVTDEKEALSIDLTQAKEEIKKVNFSIKEGIQYRYELTSWSFETGSLKHSRGSSYLLQMVRIAA